MTSHNEPEAYLIPGKEDFFFLRISLGGTVRCSPASPAGHRVLSARDRYEPYTQTKGFLGVSTPLICRAAKVSAGGQDGPDWVEFSPCRARAFGFKALKADAASVGAKRWPG